MILTPIRYLLPGLAPVILLGQGPKIDLKADDAAIRDAITRDAVQYTDDWVHWSGAFKRPTEGSERGEPFPAANMGKRKNQKHSGKVERLDIASSGDNDSFLPHASAQTEFHLLAMAVSFPNSLDRGKVGVPNGHDNFVSGVDGHVCSPGDQTC